MSADLNPRARPRRRVPRIALRVALLYAACAAVWILASDAILGAFVHEPALVTFLSIGKGWLFVLVTGILLYVLVSRGVRPIAESAEEYRGMFESHPSIYLKVDGEGTILSMNPLGAEQLGYGPGELLGRSVLHLYADSDRRVAMEQIEALAHGSTAVARWEAQAARKDGTLIWMKLSARAVQGAGGGRAILLVGEDVTEHRRSEAALGAAHENLRALFQASPLAIVALDRGGRVLSWNPAAEAIFGWSEPEVLGRPLPIVPDDRREEFVANLDRTLDGEVLSQLEFRRFRKDGTLVDVSLSSAPLRDVAGRTMGTIAVIDDITRRKEAERELGRLNRALRVLTACGQAVMRASTEDELLRGVCRIAVEVGGYRFAWIGYAESDPAKTVRPVAHSGHEDGYLGTMRITWADEERGRGPTGTSIRVGAPSVVRSTEADPSYRPWRAEAARRGYASSIGLPLTVGGQPIGALSIYSQEPDAFDEEEVRLLSELADDVAYGIVALRTREENRRSARALERSSERLRHLQEIDRAILVARSVEEVARFALGRIRQLVPCDLAVVTVREREAGGVRAIAADGGPWGKDVAVALSPDEMMASLEEIGQEPYLHLGDIAAAAPHSAFAERAAGDGLGAALLVPLRAEGDLIGGFALGSRHPVPFDPEQIEIASEIGGQLAIALHQDRLREELRRRAAELERRVEERTAELSAANEDLLSFTTSVTHDLRAPLRAIEGFARALVEDHAARLDEEGRRCADRIMAAAFRLDRIVQDLHRYSRLRRVEIRLKPVSLESVVAEVIAARDTAISAAGARVAVDPPLPDVFAHRPTLVQIVENLIDNALKFVARGVVPRVRIRADAKERSVRLWVEDNGIGIGESHRERIFKVFERLHGVETYPGSGIGLAIVRKGAERMGGSAGVESQPGHGSAFWVELEAHHGADDPRHAEPSGEDPGGTDP
ncbi:MAG: PAS domain S-box protein [Acidobacteriia bacterium]|nr:PAS domain S-box protein [Terriglobia bacterium]